jgi:hypothetical protein
LLKFYIKTTDYADVKLLLTLISIDLRIDFDIPLKVYRFPGFQVLLATGIWLFPYLFGLARKQR